MVNFKLVAAAAALFSVMGLSVQAATIGTLEGNGFRTTDEEITFGSAITGSLIGPVGTGEYSGYTLNEFETLSFETGDGNNGQTFTANSGTDEITFTITDTLVATLNATGSGLTAWNLGGLMSVEGSPPVASSAASFSISGSNVTGFDYTVFIRTPPTDFAAPVPLPAGAFLLFGALGGLALLRRRA